MKMKIQVDALDVTITISIPDSARQLALGDGRLQIIATLDEPVSLGVPAVDVTGVNAVLRERGELWVLDDGYLDAEKRQLPAPLRGAREARITVDGLEVRLPSSEVWGSSARSPHHDFIIERRSGGGWKIAPSPRSFEAIDAHLKKLVRGVDLRGLEVDRQHLAGPGLPLNPNKLEWQVAVTGMAAIEARDREDLPFPVRRLHVVVENGRATLTGDTVEPIDEARALKFERKRSDGPFGPVWPEHSEPLTPVLPSTSDADPRSSAEHSHLWLRSERGWVNVGCSEADEPSWPTTAARSGLLVALHPWFPSRPGLRIHALLDRAQTWFRLDDDGRATVKLSGLPIQVELDGCALFEPADHKAPELPPAPGRAPTTLVLVSDAWLTPSSKPPPQRFELRHDRGDWTLIAESGGCIDWRPWSKPPLLGDARWAANDPDLGVRCSGNRVLIPRAVARLALTSLPEGGGFSIPEPDARPALAGVLRGLDSGWFGLEVEATDAGTTERWRHAVALLDERYQSVDERLATTEGITVAALAATRVHEGWREDGQAFDRPPDLELEQDVTGQPPIVERIVWFAGPDDSVGVATGWVLVTTRDAHAPRWGVIRESDSKLPVTIDPRTLRWDREDAVVIAEIIGDLTGRLALRLRKRDGQWQVSVDDEAHVTVPWRLVFPEPSEGRIQALSLTKLRLSVGQAGALELHAGSVELLLGEGRACYECETGWTASLARDSEGKLVLDPNGEHATRVKLTRTERGIVVVHDHPLPGLTLREILTTPAEGSQRFQVRINGTDSARPLASDELEERGDRVMFAFSDALPGTPNDLLLAGLQLLQVNLAYLELHRDEQGRLVPKSGIIGWTIGTLAGLVPAKVTCHATFKWSLDASDPGPSVELNGVWRWPTLGGTWLEDEGHERGQVSLNVDLVIVDRSLTIDPSSQAPVETELFALAGFELRLVETSPDLTSAWKWMGHVPLRFEPGVADRPAILDLWGSYRLGVRDNRQAGPKLRLRRGNFGLILDPKASNPSEDSCLIHLAMRSDAAERIQVVATDWELDGHLAAPRELDAEIVAVCREPDPSRAAHVEFIGKTKASSKTEPWLAELMCIDEQGSTRWYASSASEWFPLDRLEGQDRGSTRLRVMAPTGLTVLATMPEIAAPDEASIDAWARRVLVRSGWHREAILETRRDQQQRWRIIDSPRLNRDLELGWLDAAPRHHAGRPGPVGRRASWPDRDGAPMPLAQLSDRPPKPSLALGDLASPSCEAKSSAIAFGLTLDPGVDGRLHERDAVIVRMSRHTPLCWDQSTRAPTPGWRRDLGNETGWARESLAPPPGPLAPPASSSDRFSARAVGLELRSAAPRPGELLDLELEAWVTRGGIQRSGGRHERRVRTCRVAPGDEQIDVAVSRGSDRTRVSWIRRHADRHSLGAPVVLVHEPRAISVDPRQPIRIWSAIDPNALRLHQAIGSSSGVQPRVWLRIQLATSLESGPAGLTIATAGAPVEIDVAALRGGYSLDITEQLADGTIAELALQLPEHDGHSQLTVSAVLAASEPEQPPADSRVTLALAASTIAGPPPSTVVVFEHLADGDRSPLAVGPEPASAWRPIYDHNHLVWAQVGTWTHHHPPGCDAGGYAVGVLSSTGAWSCSDRHR